MAMAKAISRTLNDERGDPRKGIQSVEIGLRIAGVLAAADGPLPLRDVARLSGLAGGAAHRYLVSLVRAGLAEQTGDGSYGLGGLSLRLGFAALARLDPLAVAERHLNGFVDDTGTTALISVWSERGPIVIRWKQGRRPVFTTIAIGSIMPLATSATGAIFLAWLPERQTSPLLHDLPAAERCQAASMAANARATGHASLAGDLVPGLNAVAVPVFDGSGGLAAAYTAVAAGEPITTAVMAALKSAAADAGADLGYSAT